MAGAQFVHPLVGSAFEPLNGRERKQGGSGAVQCIQLKRVISAVAGGLGHHLTELQIGMGGNTASFQRTTSSRRFPWNARGRSARASSLSSCCCTSRSCSLRSSSGQSSSKRFFRLCFPQYAKRTREDGTNITR